MAESAPNSSCSEEPPISQVYFQELLLWEKTGLGVAAGVCVAVVALFLLQVDMAVKKYRAGMEPEFHLKSLWLTGIPPVLAVTALLSLIFPRASLVADLAASVYHAQTFFQFTSLLLLCEGGLPQFLQRARLGGFQLGVPPCCCCCAKCCVTVKASASNVRRFRLLTLQTAFVTPVIALVTIILWIDEKYHLGKWAADDAFIYVTALGVVTSLMAVFGTFVLFKTAVLVGVSEPRLGLKFGIMQISGVLHTMQAFLFGLLASFQLPPCRGRLSSSVRADAIRYMIVLAEMLIMSLLIRFVKSKPHDLSHKPSQIQICDVRPHDGDCSLDNSHCGQYEKRRESEGRKDRAPNGSSLRLDNDGFDAVSVIF